MPGFSGVPTPRSKLISDKKIATPLKITLATPETLYESCSGLPTGFILLRLFKPILFLNVILNHTFEFMEKDNTTASIPGLPKSGYEPSVKNSFLYLN